MRLDGVLVAHAFFEPFDEDTPRFAVVKAGHFVNAGIPVIEIADDAHGFSVLRPNSKANAAFALDFGEVSAQHFISPEVGAVMEEI